MRINQQKAREAADWTRLDTIHLSPVFHFSGKPRDWFPSSHCLPSETLVPLSHGIPPLVLLPQLV